MSSCCGIVTYNRFSLLQNCIQSVLKQSLKPSLIIIFDNASTDGTTELLCKEHDLVEAGRSDASVIYSGALGDVHLLLYSSKYNGGGSLGFHTITKHFYENTSFDALWLMDDDGTPHNQALAELSARNEHYCGALVKNESNYNERAFKLSSEDENSVNPFNSILISRYLVGTVGYPRSDFFIYGDEVEYDLRIKHHGFKSVLVKDAIHFHPADRQRTKRKSFLGTYKIIDGSLRQYCYYRNTSYNLYKYYGTRKLLSWWTKMFIILILNNKIKETYIFLRAICELRKESFSNHYDYVK